MIQWYQEAPIAFLVDRDSTLQQGTRTIQTMDSKCEDGNQQAQYIYGVKLAIQEQTLLATNNQLLVTKYSLEAAIQLETQRLQVLDSRLSYHSRAHQLKMQEELSNLQRQTMGQVELAKTQLTQLKCRYQEQLDSILNSLGSIEVPTSSAAQLRFSPLIPGLTYQLTKSNSNYIQSLSKRLDRELVEESRLIQELKKELEVPIQGSKSAHFSNMWMPDNNTLCQESVDLIQTKMDLPSKQQMKSKMEEIVKYKSRIDRLKVSLRGDHCTTKEESSIKMMEYKVRIQLAMEEFEAMKLRRQRLKS